VGTSGASLAEVVDASLAAGPVDVTSFAIAFDNQVYQVRSWAGGHRVKTARLVLSIWTYEMWIKVKNPKAPAATRVLETSF
jgi:hypothetical protein